MSWIVLDTHVWIWLMNGDPPIEYSPQRKVIEKAVEESRLKISMISIWEVAMLEAKGRIAFELPVRQWIEQALSIPGISLAPLDEDILVDSTRLPGTVHGDPADRIIIATTRHLGATLITSDKQILEYSTQKHLKVLVV